MSEGFFAERSMEDLFFCQRIADLRDYPKPHDPDELDKHLAGES